MPQLKLSLLGGFQVDLGQAPLTGFETDKTRALLAYLAVEPRPHRREALAGLLWPEVLESSARRSLSQALFNLRQCLKDADAEPPFLLIARDSLQFNIESNYELDVAAFTAHLHAGRLAEAVELYRGDFLHGFLIEDSTAFEEWAIIQREELRRQALTTLQQLAQQAEQRGQAALGLRYANRQLELDPWREEAHQQKMRLLVLNDERSAALAQYETCRRALLDELGVEPSADTKALYEQIKAGVRTKPPAEATNAKFTAPATIPSNLPKPITPFLGRAKELAEIAQMLTDPQCRLLSLVGPGGMGKTRLVLEAAAQAQPHFPHGVIFVPLQPLTTAEAVLPAIAAAFELSDFKPSELLSNLARYLGEKQILLVLDNFEHVIEAAPVVDELLQLTPNLKVLVTSREALTIEGEWVEEVNGFTATEAEELFVQRARQVNATFAAHSEEATHIGRIVKLVAGMPLAIVLAASWARTLSVTEIVRELERGLDGLVSARRDMPERHRSIRAVFDYSWRLLSDKEQMALARLSVLRGGFTREAAEAVGGASLATLAALVSKSLVRRFASGRYDLHELVRQYAATHLYEQTNTFELARQQHLKYFLELAQNTYAAFNTRQFAMWLERAYQDYDNLEVALTWAIEHDVESALRLVGAMLYVWPRRRTAQAVPWLEKALQAANASPTPVSASARIGALCVLSWYLDYDLERGESAALEAVKLAREHPNPRDVAIALTALGVAQLGQGKSQAAIAAFEESLALLRGTEAKGDMAVILDRLGMAERYIGHYAQALKCHQQSLALAREIDNAELIADSLVSHAHIDFRLGNFERARRYTEESRPLWIAARHLSGLFWADLLLIRCNILQGRLEAALTQLQQADQILQEFWYDDTHFNEVYGYYAYFTGDLETARQRYAAAYQSSLQSGNMRGRLWTLFGLGLVARSTGNLALASELIEDAQGIAQTIFEQYFVAWAKLALGKIQTSRGQLEAAALSFKAGISITAEQGAWHLLAMHVDGLAVIASIEKFAERALVLFGLSAALREPLEMPTPPVERAEYEAALVAARGQLGEAPAIIAWEQGRALAADLEAACAFALRSHQ